MRAVCHPIIDARKPNVIAALVTAFIAGLVLLGWALDIDLFKRIIPGLVAMNPMSAMAFLLAALSLALFSTAPAHEVALLRVTLARTCAWLIVFIGIAKVVAIVGGPDLRVDQLLFSSKLSVGFRVPNVMAPNTALNFFLIGNALIVIHSKRRHMSPLACIAALICGFEALLAVLGYAYGIGVFYGMHSFIPMALHTAVAFLVVAFGIMSCQASSGFLAVITGNNAGGMMARRLLPAAILVPAVIGWLRLEGQRIGFFDSEFGVALYTVTNMLVFGSLVACNAYLLFKTDAARAKADHRVRRTHDELEERKHQLETAVHANQLIMDNSRDVICTVDENGSFITVSAASEALWGYKPQELCGRAYIEMVHPEDRARTNQVAADIMTGSAVNDFENRYIRKDGSFIDVMWSAYWSEADRLMFAVARDSTERARTEKALKEAKEEADRANRAKSEFLSRMSHELRTPMNAILGFAQLLEMEELTEDQQESVGHIIRGGRHLLELINEVLDISRIEAGRMSLSPEPVLLADVLCETIDLVRPLATDREVRVTSRDVSDLYVLADRQRLKQILINLISNSIKYNRTGGSVTLSCEARDGRARILITDTGLGIPAERIEQLFTPFERLGAEQSTIEGTGLGLAVAKRLAEAMQGSIGVESVSGQGSTFWLELPLTQSPLALAKLLDEEPTIAHIDLRETRNVLYIEDNLSNLRLIERVLLRRPLVALHSAANGREGLKLAREQMPDLILLDLNLPDIHGHEVLNRLQSDPRCAGIPVVVISADATLAQKKRLLQAGAKEYLSKPLNIQKFLGVLDRSLIAANRNPQLSAEK